ncbi:hypothetical protein BDZ89DRAFT_950867 [Hymenopellis radicata]|nr:hypothetical protein BDZ89DRAFT_950867 [Hymenopellis radicata]
MATPATPPRTGLRSASSTIPSSAPVPNLEPYTRPHSALATLRPAEGDAEEIPGDDEDVDDGDFIDDKNYHGASKKRKGGLTVLSHVRAFVDVRDAHTSRDSGEAFVEFLETLGAKVLKKLTKTCTHIVFRNGSFNTVSKWKAAETKPLVVRISWLMECVDKKEHVAEDEHLLDISDLFPSGVDPKVLRPSFVSYSSLTSIKIRVRSSRLGHSDGADESCETCESICFIHIGDPSNARAAMDSSSQPSRWLGGVVERAERAATESSGTPCIFMLLSFRLLSISAVMFCCFFIIVQAV